MNSALVEANLHKSRLIVSETVVSGGLVFQQVHQRLGSGD